MLDVTLRSDKPLRVRRAAAQLLAAALIAFTVPVAAAGVAAAGSEGGTITCRSSRWVSIRSDSLGVTVHDYANGQQYAWLFDSRTVKYSSSGQHDGGWYVSAETLYTAGTYGLCLT